VTSERPATIDTYCLPSTWYDIGPLTICPPRFASSVEQSLAFYCDVLGFAKAAAVPDQSPYVFAAVQSGPVEIFLNA
jgi:glyoxalase/bleomycin resistance protein/dioxygenase superfamily protein